MNETARVGKRGTVVLPVRLRRKLGLAEGSLLLVEEQPGGVLLRPAVAYPVEQYPPLRVAELLLNSAVDVDDYARARMAVQELGIDPDQVPHEKP